VKVGTPYCLGQLGHRVVLLVPRARRVPRQDADAEGAFLEPLLHPRDDAGNLVGGGDAVLPPGAPLRLLEVRDGAVGLHLLLLGDAPEHPRRGEAVVDGAPLLAGALVGQPHGERPRLQLERGGHAVKRLHARRGQLLPVRVQVDEAGGHHVAARVQRVAPAQRRPADGRDGAVADPHPAQGVQPGFRVDGAAVGDHEIVRRGRGGAGLRGQREREGGQQQGGAEAHGRSQRRTVAIGTGALTYPASKHGASRAGRRRAPRVAGPLPAPHIPARSGPLRGAPAPPRPPPSA